ncbi:hypothetical protein [Kordiimonas marina]|uniref:hypothetical protein n=1 Tax=Kordiimonas marina TaxID=2872312 RepID=UPI001FF2F8E4|nr:hypothetical protein [Kordiimonas marina]MCJ9430427.1 hypothetical protein [Kordiimonas marina]
MSSISPMRMVRKFSKKRRNERLSDTLAVGDRYEQADRTLSIWVVERITKLGSSQYPLVSLAREDHPDLKKTVSVAVLEEGEDFRPAGEVTPPMVKGASGEPQAPAA